MPVLRDKGDQDGDEERSKSMSGVTNEKHLWRSKF
jgi:hypothetical protein